MVIIENNETNSDKRNVTYLAERSQRFYAVVLDALATGNMQVVGYGNLMNLGVDMSCCIYLTGTDD